MDFKITEEHVKLLRRSYITWNEGDGDAPGVDCKRPYGNSYMAGDVASILGWGIEGEDGLTQAQEERACALHREMETVLQILVANPIGLQGTWKQINGKWEILF